MKPKIVLLSLIVLLLAGILEWWLHLGGRSRFSGSLGRPPGQKGEVATLHPTFSRDIAPIAFQNCSPCHHPAGSGPFSLVAFSDFQKRARQVAELTNSRTMPPWMPDRSCGPFEDERGLTEQQIALFQRWAADGAPEGDRAVLPAAPEFSDQWKLGTPDLIVKAASAFTIPAQGKDTYRNFVLALAMDAARSVRAVELRTSNPRIVHHAGLMFDDTGAARLRAAREGGSSYSGMYPGDGPVSEQGRFLMWQPGTPACIDSSAEPWRLPAGADLVLQMHLRSRGKPEPIQPEVGLYFTDKPPASLLLRRMLRSTSIDIPAGSADYAVENSYVLPVDAEVLAVSNHAHYLGKDLQGYAILPDGSRRMLLRIPNWSFYWQGSYTFLRPVPLPKGTTLQMHFTYDNSAQNPSNPSSPPRRVVFGPNSDDEMGEFWFQLRVHSAGDYGALVSDYAARIGVPDMVQQEESLIRQNPNDADLHAMLAQALVQAGREKEALRELQTAFLLRSDCAKAHRCLANILARRGDVKNAIEQFRKAVAADPADFRSQADLGLALASAGNLAEGIEQLQQALRLNPRDALAHTNLGRVYAYQHRIAEARVELQRALQLEPDQSLALETLRSLPTQP